MGDRLRQLWDFDDLDVSERRFSDQLANENLPAGRAEVLTQLARVQGLRERFVEGERLIEEAESVAGADTKVAIRVDLERGRLRRSSGDPVAALPLFVAAYERALNAGDRFLAADAAHMAALAAASRDERLDWARRGIAVAEGATDRDDAYWLGPLYNNLGCEHAEAGNHEAALVAFQRSLEARLRYPENAEAIEWARESVAEELRVLGREGEVSAGDV